jgi:hypothetical protein
MGAAPLLEGVLKGSVADQAHMPMKLIARYSPFMGKDGANHILTWRAVIHRAIWTRMSTLRSRRRLDHLGR